MHMMNAWGAHNSYGTCCMHACLPTCTHNAQRSLSVPARMTWRKTTQAKEATANAEKIASATSKQCLRRRTLSRRHCCHPTPGQNTHSHTHIRTHTCNEKPTHTCLCAMKSTAAEWLKRSQKHGLCRCPTAQLLLLKAR